MAKTGKRLLEGERVTIRSGVLPLEVGKKDGYELRGMKAKVVQEERLIPGVDAYGQATGKTEERVTVRPVLPDGRLGSVVELPRHRVEGGKTFSSGFGESRYPEVSKSAFAKWWEHRRKQLAAFIAPKGSEDPDDAGPGIESDTPETTSDERMERE